MGQYVEISLLLLSLSVFTLVLLFIILLYEIWKSVKGITAVLHTLSESLPAILKNLEGITAAMNETMATVNERVEGLSAVARRIQDILGFAADLQQIFLAGVGRPLFRMIRTTAAISRAVKVFAAVLRSGREK